MHARVCGRDISAAGDTRSLIIAGRIHRLDTHVSGSTNQPNFLTYPRSHEITKVPLVFLGHDGGEYEGPCCRITPPLAHPLTLRVCLRL